MVWFKYIRYITTKEVHHFSIGPYDHNIIDMYSAKDLVWISILLSGYALIKGQDVSSSSLGEGLKGNCSCGGFPSSSQETVSQPLLAQSPGLVVNCDEEGASTCKNLCFALATATKAKGPEILCQRLKNANELKLSAFYKVCDKPWSYANMTADEALCCEDSKVKICEATEAHVTTAEVITV